MSSGEFVERTDFYGGFRKLTEDHLVAEVDEISKRSEEIEMALPADVCEAAFTGPNNLPSRHAAANSLRARADAIGAFVTLNAGFLRIDQTNGPRIAGAS